MTIEELIGEYEKKAADIRSSMTVHEKMGAGQYYRHKLAMISDFIRELKKVELPGWIPCSDQLPETEEMVLVSCETKKGYKSVNRAYHSNGFWHGSGSMSGVVAWQPLPDPYEGEVDG